MSTAPAETSPTAPATTPAQPEPQGGGQLQSDDGNPVALTSKAAEKVKDA